MATTRLTVSPDDGWVLVASADTEQFYVENVSLELALVAFDEATPDVDSGYHYLNPGAALIRVAPGNLYAKARGQGSLALVISQ